jgi:hypothetical protein
MAENESRARLAELAREELRREYPKSRDAKVKLWLSGKLLPEHIRKTTWLREKSSSSPRMARARKNQRNANHGKARIEGESAVMVKALSGKFYEPEHVTDGSPCWCGARPDKDGVVVHIPFAEWTARQPLYYFLSIIHHLSNAREEFIPSGQRTRNVYEQ